LETGPTVSQDDRLSRDEHGQVWLNCDAIGRNPYQPRQQFDETEIADLADSIRTHGILQPLVVRKAGDSYELIAGERRLRAAKLAGLERVPAIVRDTEEAERLELALIENMAREDLNPIDEARACATLVDDLGVTKEELGRRVGRSRVAISNAVRLLELPDEVQAMLQAGELSAGHGRALLMCKDHGERKRLARAARDGDWSVRETERRAKAVHDPAARSRRRQVVVHPDLAEAMVNAANALTAAIGWEAKVSPSGRRFKVEIQVEDVRDVIDLASRIGRQQHSRAA
jgi:ParB family chromosome partitioning protein